MKLIVGLGNPGKKYRLTRHNIGANVAKRLAELNDINLRRRRYLSRFGEGKIGNEDVSIILPMTYMNLSGKAVGLIVKNKRKTISDILIICDDADLNLGDIRIRSKGSDGGHRGLRSIIENLGTDSFSRLRIGIGKEGDLEDHVLKPFERDERDKVEEVEKRALDATLCWLTKGIAETMNLYNVKKEN